MTTSAPVAEVSDSGGGIVASEKGRYIWCSDA